MSTTEPIDQPENEHQSFDDFWAEQQRKEAAERGEQATEVIRSIRVNVPHDLPMRFDRRLDAAAGEAEVKIAISDLFGVDALGAWVDAGMTHLEFKTILLWGIAHGRGNPLTFGEAYELAKKKDAEGKAPPTTRSAASGGRSRRTSAASTSSRRKTSKT